MYETISRLNQLHTCCTSTQQCYLRLCFRQERNSRHCGDRWNLAEASPIVFSLYRAVCMCECVLEISRNKTDFTLQAWTYQMQ